MVDQGPTTDPNPLPRPLSVGRSNAARNHPWMPFLLRVFVRQGYVSWSLGGKPLQPNARQATGPDPKRGVCMSILTPCQHGNINDSGFDLAIAGCLRWALRYIFATAPGRRGLRRRSNFPAQLTSPIPSRLHKPQAAPRCPPPNFGY